MKTINNNRNDYLSGKWGFIKADFSIVVDALRSWFLSLYHDVEMVPLNGDIERLLEFVAPRRVPGSKYLITTTDSQWTACFSESHDVTSLVGHMSEVLFCDALEICALSPNGKKGEEDFYYPACQFVLYSDGTDNILNIKRSIVCMNDGGRWIFETYGEVQPFEEIDEYSAKRVRDRFTIEMLDRYCQALGINALDSSFYGRDGLLFRLNDPK